MLYVFATVWLYYIFIYEDGQDLKMRYVTE